MTTPTPRIDALFTQTKLVCFGRYTLRVPLEAQLNWGSQIIYEGFITHPNAAERAKEIINQHWAKVRFADDSAELIEVRSGPTPGGICLWYYKSDMSKERDTRDFFGVTIANGHAFTYKGMALKGKASSDFVITTELIRNLRYRDPDEIPTEPGVCIQLGFVKENTYRFQEDFAAGIYLPSLPDVSFSVSSNTGANTVGLGAKGLLHSMQEQRGILGSLYPQFTSFREGKKTIGLWNGEEVLSRRKDGTHEFDWGAISAERSVAQPGRLRVKLYSKVEQNRIGAATQASVSDAEAIALWDKLLGSLTYRVEVLGGPVQKAAP